MGFSSSALSFVHNTDAEFRAWVGGIINGLASAGAVRTSDTGQIDLATVTRPTSSSSQMRGYAMYRLGVGATATYIKLEFGGGNTAVQTGIQVSVGFATDGAGNLIGESIPAMVQYNSTPSATPSMTYFSASAEHLTVAWNTGGTAASRYLIHTELLVDGSGLATAQGVFMLHAGSTSGSQANEVLLRGGAPRWQRETALATWMTSNSSTVYGANVALYPVFPVFLTLLNACKHLQCYRLNDITPDTMFTVEHYSQMRTMLALPGHFPGGSTNGNNARYAIAWEA